jgi:hypothetical protein
MNFMGLHTYPNAEPTVWTGLPTQFDPATGEVNESYYTSYMTTGGGGDWGGAPTNTTDSYPFGSRQLMAGGPQTPFCFGSDLLDGHGSCETNHTDTSSQNTLFNTVGQMLARAFSFGRLVGVKTCMGTEAPLVPPANSAKTATPQALYEGIFRRLAALGVPLDYYWIWTGEGWPARANPTMPTTDPSIAGILADFLAADAAKHAVGDVMENTSLATCGWTLGPKVNRSYFDRLPPGWTLSSINEAVGNTPTEPEYQNVTNHAKWAIPWLEDDPGLLAPQLWLNRTIEYAQQAVDYGATGLLGIHWRVKEVSPQLSALAKFPWSPTTTSVELWEQFFAEELGGSSPTSLKAAAIMATVDSFKLPRPDHWSGPGMLNQVCDPNFATNYAFVDQFVALRTDLTDLDALSRFDFWANSFTYMRLMAVVGCDWNHLAACAAKLPIGTRCVPNAAPAPPNSACYRDCGGSFDGNRIMPTTAAISDPAMTREKCALACHNLPDHPVFAGVEFGVACFCGPTAPDSTYAIPCPTTTPTCGARCPCGGNKTETCGGACILEAYSYTCANPNAAARKVAASVCIPLSEQLVNSSTLLMNALLATVETTGTIGSVENLVQHSFPAVFSPIADLEDALGTALPPSAKPGIGYTGVERLFLTTPRQSAPPSTALPLQVYTLAQSTKSTPGSRGSPLLHYREMGSGTTTPWTELPTTLKMADRGVYTVEIPASAMTADVEYYFSWGALVWPAGAPTVPHTVVVV